MGGPIPDIRIWDGTEWVPHQPIRSDGATVTIYEAKVSADGIAWWPQTGGG